MFSNILHFIREAKCLSCLKYLSKKPNRERTSPEQLRHYVQFCKNNPAILAGKNTPICPRNMEQLWQQCADGLNALKGPTKTVPKWKEIWKKQLRFRARKIHKKTRGLRCGNCLNYFGSGHKWVGGGIRRF